MLGQINSIFFPGAKYVSTGQRFNSICFYAIIYYFLSKQKEIEFYKLQLKHEKENSINHCYIRTSLNE